MPSTRAPAKHCCFDGRARRRALPNTALPAAQEWNHIGADVILAQELKGLVRRRHAVMGEGADSLLPCRHAILMIRAAKILMEFDATISCCDGSAGCIYNAHQCGINQRASQWHSSRTMEEIAPNERERLARAARKSSSRRTRRLRCVRPSAPKRILHRTIPIRHRMKRPVDA